MQNFHSCLGRQRSTTWLSLLNAKLLSILYKPCAMCLILIHFQPCARSEPVCNCCLSNKYTYMQLRSPEVTRVNFHLTLWPNMYASISILHFGSNMYDGISILHNGSTCMIACKETLSGPQHCFHK